MSDQSPYPQDVSSTTPAQVLGSKGPDNCPHCGGAGYTIDHTLASGPRKLGCTYCGGTGKP